MPDELRWWLVIGGTLILLFIATVLIIISRKKRSKNEIEEFPELLEALGGLSNISNVTLNGSRISMNFENKKSVDKEQIKECGVETIVVSNKKITLVIGKTAHSVYKYLNKQKEV